LFASICTSENNNHNKIKEGNVNVKAFKVFLAQWAVKHRIPHVTLTDLLSGLSTTYEIFSDLPKCAKLCYVHHDLRILQICFLDNIIILELNEVLFNFCLWSRISFHLLLNSKKFK